MTEQHGSAAALRRLISEIEGLLKEPSVGLELGRRGVNTSIALVAAQGLGAYVDGDLRRAGDDLSTAAEEIQTRLARK